MTKVECRTAHTMAIGVCEPSFFANGDGRHVAKGVSVAHPHRYRYEEISVPTGNANINSPQQMCSVSDGEKGEPTCMYVHPYFILPLSFCFFSFAWEMLIGSDVFESGRAHGLATLGLKSKTSWK